jgi:hypothetical protein
MNLQSSFANNFWVQMAALVIVVAIIIALAAKYEKFSRRVPSCAIDL